MFGKKNKEREINKYAKVLTEIGTAYNFFHFIYNTRFSQHNIKKYSGEIIDCILYKDKENGERKEAKEFIKNLLGKITTLHETLKRKETKKLFDSDKEITQKYERLSYNIESLMGKIEKITDIIKTTKISRENEKDVLKKIYCEVISLNLRGNEPIKYQYENRYNKYNKMEEDYSKYYELSPSQYLENTIRGLFKELPHDVNKIKEDMKELINYIHKKAKNI